MLLVSNLAAQAISAPPRKRLPLHERRAVIVEAAGELFGERGYDDTRLDDVAAAAGVTKPVLYRHFESKRALYLALLERHRDDLARFTALVPDTGSMEERIRAVVEVWLDYVESHSYAWRMLFRDRGGGPEIEAFRRGVHDRARDVLMAMFGALSERALPRREIAPLAELISMGMASLVLWWIEGADVSREAVRDAITRVWVGLLTG
jgi:AcrR family transcriptional regulator